MTVLAYTYEADVHCTDCTKKRFYYSTWNWEDAARGKNIRYIAGQLPLDSDGNDIHALFCTDEWQEYDETFLAENPTQYLACGDCHEVIDEYTHEG